MYLTVLSKGSPVSCEGLTVQNDPIFPPPEATLQDLGSEIYIALSWLI
jgi:hypothetical protein